MTSCKSCEKRLLVTPNSLTLAETLDVELTGWDRIGAPA